jgi:hypothetical protein
VQMTLVVLHLLRHKRFASKSWGLNMPFWIVADYLNVMYHKVVSVFEIQMLLRREIDTLYLPFFSETSLYCMALSEWIKFLLLV